LVEIFLGQICLNCFVLITNPLKQRHKNRAERKHIKPRTLKKKETEEIFLTESEFFLFRENIKGKYKIILQDLAAIQFYGPLRVSEAAATKWENVFFDRRNSSSSYLIIKEHIYWPRIKGSSPKILSGFKNSKFLPGEIKKNPLYRETFEVLSRLHKPGAKGLIFTALDGTILEYRSIQHAYDKAFKGASLPFSGTHIMRHGGASMVYNKTGDISLVMQQLGVTNQNTALIYAKRDKDALSDFTKKLWAEGP
jgi:integrase